MLSLRATATALSGPLMSLESGQSSSGQSSSTRGKIVLDPHLVDEVQKYLHASDDNVCVDRQDDKVCVDRQLLLATRAHIAEVDQVIAKNREMKSAMDELRRDAIEDLHAQRLVDDVLCGRLLQKVAELESRAPRAADAKVEAEGAGAMIVDDAAPTEAVGGSCGATPTTMEVTPVQKRIVKIFNFAIR